MKAVVKRIKRTRAELGPGDPRFEVQTVMPAFYLVPDVIVVEYDDEAASFSVLKVEVHGVRYRRLMKGVKEAGRGSLTFRPGSMASFTGNMPAELHDFARDLWWAE